MPDCFEAQNDLVFLINLSFKFTKFVFFKLSAKVK